MSDNQGHGEKKSRLQDAAIASLLVQPTIRDAAKEVGVSEATICRWLKDTAFMIKYKDAKREVMKHTVTRLQQAASSAVDTLFELMSDENVTDNVRLGAARSIMEFSLKSTEQEDISFRIEILERSQGVRYE